MSIPRFTLTGLACALGFLMFSTAPALAAAPEAPEEVTVQSPVKATEATFHGFLNPKAPGELGTYEFLYKKSPTECTGESKAPASPGISVGTEHEEVSETVAGLKAGTTYTMCLLARNGTKVGENEAVSAPPVTFTTATPAEKPKTEPASGETGTTATLHGVLNPTVEAETGWYFAYSTGAKCTSGGPGGGETAHEAPAKVKALAVEKEVTGLEPNKAYKFCLLATNTAEEPTLGAEVPLKTSPLPPTISGESTSGVTSTAATLDAQINTNNQKTKYTFEYSTTASGNPLVLEAPIVEVNGASELGTEDVNQTASVPAGVLLPGTTYYYRVVATNESAEKTEGPVQSFTTVPTPFTDEVKAIASTFAQFHGHMTPLNPNVATQYHFSYKLGSECAGESSTPSSDAGKGPGTEVAETEGVDTLQPNAEYTVCFVTSNAFGSTEGPAVHFTTLAAPLYIASESASAVSATEATLEAKINPNNENTTYSFEYATNEALTGATIVPGAPPAAELKGFGNQAVAVGLAGLSTGETYYYRVVAENATSKVDGGINHFTALGAPRVTTEEAQNVTSFSAELAAAVNPAGLPTTYHFLYVAAANYEPLATNPYANGTTTPESSVSPNSTIIHPVFFFASGLQPGETYDYTIVATNAQGGPVVGPNQAFTTAAAPPTPLITNPGGAGEVTPPAPAPGAVFPLLSYPSIAELNAKEAQEAKKIPTPTKPLTNAQKLTKALKACHKKKGAKRTTCEKQAHSKYGKKKGKK